METVLLYNIANTPLASALKPVLLKMKLRVKVITPKQYLQPVGYLAGLPGILKQERTYDGAGFSEPMMVMSGFTERRLDQFLKELRQKRVPTIHLKAIITAHNQSWDSLRLFQELKEEHESMHPKYDFEKS